MNIENKSIILFYSLSNIGGAEKNFLSLARELHNRHCDTNLFLGGEVNESYNVNGISLYNLGEQPNLMRPVSIIRCLFQIHKIIMTFHTDSLEFISFGPIYSFLAAITKLTLPKHYKVRMTVCERNSISLKSESVLVKLARWIYFCQADMITSNSRKNYDLIAKRGHKGNYLVRNYYEDRSLTAKHQCFDEQKFVIVSRLEPQKRVIEIIKTLSEIQLQNAIQVDIFGTGSEYQQLEAFAQKINNIRNQRLRVKLYGFVPNKDITLSQYDLSLHFSDYEGASNSMIEALLNGIPVLCSMHHVEEVDFLVQFENCFVCDLDELNSKISEILYWLDGLNRETVRQVSLVNLERHPLIHELIIQEV